MLSRELGYVLLCSVYPLHRLQIQESDNGSSMKKPRRSQRLSQHIDPFEEIKATTQLPSPVTRNGDSEDTDTYAQRATKSPSPSQKAHHHQSPEPSSHTQSGLHSPPSDTQPFSQFIAPAPYSYEVKDEEGEGVWGYLVPLDGVQSQQQALVLKRRSACPFPEATMERTDGKHRVAKDKYTKQEEGFEEKKATVAVPAGGYLIGRHPECGKTILLLVGAQRY